MGGILLAFDDVVEELASLHVLHDEEELLGCFDDFIQLNDAGMPYQFKDMDLAGDPLNIGHIHNFVLL